MRAEDVEECLKKIRRAIELYERARASPNSITVTQVARKIASPRSHKSSAQAGIKTHNVWGDPFQACTSDEYWTPLPLAYELEGVWIYGVADLVRFQNGRPVEVIELKHYGEPDEYAEVQVIIYAWLLTKIFSTSPKAYVVAGWNGNRYTTRLEARFSTSRIELKIRMILQR